MPAVLTVLPWALGGLGVGTFFGFSLSDGFKRMVNVIIVVTLIALAFKFWKVK